MAKLTANLATTLFRTSWTLSFLPLDHHSIYIYIYTQTFLLLSYQKVSVYVWYFLYAIKTQNNINGKKSQLPILCTSIGLLVSTLTHDSLWIKIFKTKVGESNTNFFSA